MIRKEIILVTTDAKRTAEHWDTESAWQPGRGVYWVELPAVQDRINRKISGQSHVGWVEFAVRHYLVDRLPLDRCLTLGCGEGGQERWLASLGVFNECDAYDISEGSIDRARHAAHVAGYDHIHYHVADINTLVLPIQHYEAIWIHNALHHLERLEHVCQQISRSLASDGLLVILEYVGPNRFQFPPYQRQVIQACLDLLPVAYRRVIREELHARSFAHMDRNNLAWLARRIVDKWQDGDLLATLGRRRRLWAASSGAGQEKTSVSLPTERSVIAVDPSEAVRSAEIVPILRRHFEILEYKPLGGTILQFLLADIAGSFQQDAGGQQLLEMLFAIEDTLMSTGHLESDFAYIVAAPKVPTS